MNKLCSDVAARREAEYLAATSEQMQNMDISWGFLRIPGRPHLKVGSKILLQHPLSLLIAIIQMTLTVVLAHDLFLTIIPSGDFFVIQFASTSLWISPSLIHPFLFVATSLYLINVGWSVMAADIAGKPLHPKLLLAGLMGWLPMVSIKEFLLPHWIHHHFKGEDKSILWGKTRLAHVLTSFWAGTELSKSRSDLALARALDKNGNVIVDGLSSYVMYPVVGGIVMIFLMGISTNALIDPIKIDDRIAAVKLCKDQAIQRELDYFYTHKHQPNLNRSLKQEASEQGGSELDCDGRVPQLPTSPVPGVLFLSYVGWLSFNRASLFAMILGFMAEESEAPPLVLGGECRQLDWHYWLGATIDAVMIASVVGVVVGAFFHNLSKVIH